MSATWSRYDQASLARFVDPRNVRWVRLGTADMAAGRDPDGRARLVRSVFDALVGCEIRSAADRYRPHEILQKISTAPEVLAVPSEATPLDLALLFSGMCLGLDLLPLLIVTERHAMVAVSLSHAASDWNAPDRAEAAVLRLGPTGDAALLRQLVSGGTYIALDCHAAAEPEDFEVAVAAGVARLDAGVSDPLRFALDAAIAYHDWGIVPERIGTRTTITAGGLVLDLDDAHGCRVNVATAERRAEQHPLPRPRVPDLAPLPQLVGREAELEAARAALEPGSSVAVVGDPGSGKTALLRGIAAGARDARFPDGMVYVSARGMAPGDIETAIFDSFHDATELTGSDPARSALLAGIGAVVLLDDVEAPLDAVPALSAALHRSALLITTEDQAAVGSGHVLHLGGLGVDDAVSLVAGAVGRPLDDADRDAARRLAKACDGHPGRLIQVVQSVRVTGESLAAHVDAVGDDAPPSRFSALSALARLSSIATTVAQTAETVASATGGRVERMARTAAATAARVATLSASAGTAAEKARAVAGEVGEGRSLADLAMALADAGKAVGDVTDAAGGAIGVDGERLESVTGNVETAADLGTALAAAGAKLSDRVTGRAPPLPEPPVAEAEAGPAPALTHEPKLELNPETHRSKLAVGRMKAIFGSFSAPARQVVGILATARRVPIGAQILERLVGPEVGPVLDQLVATGLVQAHSPRYTLAPPLADDLTKHLDPGEWDDAILDKVTDWAEGASCEGPDAIAAEGQLIGWATRRGVARSRWPQVQRLVRASESALALGGLWQAWEESLQSGLEAARRLEDRSFEAWALHQLGARSLALGDAGAARQLFDQAATIRTELGDEAGAAASRLTPTPEAPPGRKYGKLGAALVTGILLALLAGGIALADPRAAWMGLGADLGELAVGDSSGLPITASSPDAAIMLRDGTGQFSVASCPPDWQGDGVCLGVVSYRPAALGPARAVVEVRDNGKVVEIPFEADATSRLVDFGAVPVGTTAFDLAPIVNPDGGVVELAGPSGDSSFTVVSGDPPCPPIGSCEVGVAFSPQVAGPAAATLRVMIGDLPAAIQLRGEGTAAAAPGLRFEPAPVTFGDVAYGEVGPPVTIHLVNDGSDPTAVSPSDIVLRGPHRGRFRWTNVDCGGDLVAAGGRCLLTVQFVPGEPAATEPAWFVAELTMEGEQRLSLPLTGRAVAASSRLSFAPNPLDFGGVLVGDSVQRSVTVTNTGSSDLALMSIAVEGEGRDAFAIFDAEAAEAGFEPARSSAFATPAVLRLRDTAAVAVQSTPGECALLAAGATCQLEVLFRPATAGEFVAVMTARDGAGNTLGTLQMQGTALDAAGPVWRIQPGRVDFGAADVGRSTARSLTVSNVGSGEGQITTVEATGAHFAAAGCAGATVAPGDTCTVLVTFAPVAGGRSAGTLTATTADGVTLAIDLGGAGIAPGGSTTPTTTTSPITEGTTTTTGSTTTPTGGTTTTTPTNPGATTTTTPGATTTSTPGATTTTPGTTTTTPGTTTTTMPPMTTTTTTPGTTTTTMPPTTTTTTTVPGVPRLVLTPTSAVVLAGGAPTQFTVRNDAAATADATNIVPSLSVGTGFTIANGCASVWLTPGTGSCQISVAYSDTTAVRQTTMTVSSNDPTPPTATITGVPG